MKGGEHYRLVVLHREGRNDVLEEGLLRLQGREVAPVAHFLVEMAIRPLPLVLPDVLLVLRYIQRRATYDGRRHAVSREHIRLSNRSAELVDFDRFTVHNESDIVVGEAWTG